LRLVTSLDPSGIAVQQVFFFVVLNLVECLLYHESEAVLGKVEQ
jgi:hypothetical protein